MGSPEKPISFRTRFDKRLAKALLEVEESDYEHNPHDYFYSTIPETDGTLLNKPNKNKLWFEFYLCIKTLEDQLSSTYTKQAERGKSTKKSYQLSAYYDAMDMLITLANYAEKIDKSSTYIAIGLTVKMYTEMNFNKLVSEYSPKDYAHLIAKLQSASRLNKGQKIATTTKTNRANKKREQILKIAHELYQNGTTRKQTIAHKIVDEKLVLKPSGKGMAESEPYSHSTILKYLENVEFE